MTLSGGADRLPVSLAAIAEQSRRRVATCSAQVVDRVLELIARATVPPEQRRFPAMVSAGLAPLNPATRHRFAGQNRVLLASYLWANNLTDPRFLTHRQAAKMGEELGVPVAVRPGAQGVTILRPCRIGVATTPDDSMTLADLADLELPGQGSEPPEDARVYLTPYTLYHASQITNLPPHPGALRSVPTDGMRALTAFRVASGVDPERADAAGDPHGTCARKLLWWFHGTAMRNDRKVFVSDDRCVDEAIENLRAHVFATVAMATVGVQPYLPEAPVDEWVELARSPAVCRRLAGAVLDAMPALDALQTHLAGRTPDIAWWGKSNAELAELAEDGVSTPAPVASNVVPILR